MISFLLLMASPGTARPDLIIADKSMKPSAVIEAARAVGIPKPQIGSKFVRVVLDSRHTEQTATRVLKGRGIDFVFRSDAQDLQIDSEPSVRRYVEFLQAKRVLQLRPEREKRAKKGSAPAEEGWGDFYEALAWYLRNRVGSDGKLSREMYQQGAAHRDAMPPAVWGGRNSYAPGGVFTTVGPRNTTTPYSQYMSAGPISGRKNGVAYAPSNANVIYVASAGGGVWKSTNAGASFTQMNSDKWPFLNTTCVAVHPTNPNIAWVGTGDYYGFFTKNAFGVMKTTDGGATWTNVGNSGMRSAPISRILVDPTNANILVATCGQGGDHNSSIHRSVDGGNTWTQTTSPTGDWDDLDISTSGVFYACGTLPGSTGGVFKSTDKGVTWTVLTNPAVNEQKALELACSKVSATTLYLLVTGDQKIYKSTNSGTSWTEITGNFPNGTAQDPNYNWSQASYDYHISCAKDGTTDLVFVGLITVAMSRGGNTTWVDIGRSFADTTPNHIHSDQHSFAMNPATPNQVLLGCDGGLWRFTLTPGTSNGTWAQLNNSFIDVQHYELAVSNAGDGWLQGGCQDNFTPSCRGNYSAWIGLPAGDGAWAGYGPGGQNFVTNQMGGIFLFTSLTDPTGDFIRPQSQAFQTGFFAPFVYAENPGKIYAGANTLWRYNNNNTWTNFNTDITPYQPQQGEPINAVNELETAKSDKSVVYSGSSNGEVFRIGGNGTAYKQIDSASIDRPVGAIDTSWSNPNDVLVGLMGSTNGNPRLWRCTNTLATTPVWTPAGGTGTTGLPDVPINTIERDPHDANRWYVGTDVGCFMTTNSGASWANMTALGIPNVATDAILVNPARTTLFIGTFGRGVWKAPLSTVANGFSLAGRVTTTGGAAVSGATVKLNRKRTTTVTVNTNPNAPIPDWDANGVMVPINMTTNTVITNVNAYVSITHYAPNDLEIWLISPQGLAKMLWSSLLPVPPNLAKNFQTLFFNGSKSGGTWYLLVRDLVPALEGTVNTFNLSFSYETYLSQATTTTNASGDYLFTGLEAGMYQVTPSQTGKTFSPSSRFPSLGPSLTGVNFTRTN